MAFLAGPVQLHAKGKAQPCAASLAKCPVRGCAKNDTPDAISNALKRHATSGGEPTKITFSVLAQLQAAVEKAFDGNYAKLTKSDRLRLRKLPSVSVGEGDFVELVGYIAIGPKGSKPHANTGESVNCRLTAPADNDFHISLTPQPKGQEFVGAVVEMIPQGRDELWTEKRLQKVQQKGLSVRVRGQLFLDNHHHVNDDPKNVIGGQPKRMSLWEIHPIQEFAVCTKTTCDEESWTDFAQWEVGQ